MSRIFLLLALSLTFGLVQPACSEAGPPQLASSYQQPDSNGDRSEALVLAAADSPLESVPLAHHGSEIACIKGDPKQGKAQYDMFCTTCHGATGDGDGPASAALSPKPAKHSDGTYMNALSNENLYKTIGEGGTAVGKSPLMAAWGGVLNEDQLWDVVAYVRSLARDPAYTCP